MAYKKIDNYFSFADIAIQKYADKNRSLKFLKTINNTIDWEPVDELLIKFYKPGKSNKGERAYSPLFLFKCMMLQKWFQIKSDPELESQIYDWISFKFFLDMPFDAPSPDHSTFSRFRKRISKDAMVQINSALLKQFHRDGITINKGVAVDARLVKSASKPVSKKKIGKLREQHNSPEGKLDKNGNPKKFTRDIDSDWTFKNDKYHYGLKEHADKIQTAYADKGYAGTPNREFLVLNDIKDGIMRKDNVNAKLTDIEITRNKAISKYRYIVEQYFGLSHLYDKGYRARFPQIMKNTIDIMFRQFAFNLKKGAKILEVLPV